jgi:hypothetical protein
MREKVEREGVGGPWKGECSRANQHGYVHRLDKVATSYFFTNFPEEVKAADLWPRFAKFGRVGEVFIPAKVDKQGKKFGFVKFRDVKDEKELLRRISNIWIDSFKIRINLSKFTRRSEPTQKRDERRGDPDLTVNRNYGGGKMQVGKSFKSALVLDEGGKKGVDVAHNTTVKEGQETEGRVRRQEEVVWEVKVEEERLAKLEGAYVGYLVEDSDALSIQNNFRMDGFQDLSVCVMGFRMVLLWSNKAEEVKEVVETVG